MNKIKGSHCATAVWEDDADTREMIFHKDTTVISNISSNLLFYLQRESMMSNRRRQNPSAVINWDHQLVVPCFFFPLSPKVRNILDSACLHLWLIPHFHIEPLLHVPGSWSRMQITSYSIQPHIYFYLIKATLNQIQIPDQESRSAHLNTNPLQGSKESVNKQTATEEGPRRSQRNRTLTEKRQELLESKSKRLLNSFTIAYGKWKSLAR